jgi:hypothetical protein
VDAYRAVLRGARPQSPRAWLLAISENVRRRRFRTAQRRPREELVEDADFPLAAELPYERSRALLEALATLSPGQRRIFVLREIVGLSYAEIAEELDSTVGSVQMLLFRARRSLRDLLDPPTVAARRPIFLPPLPGWLAGLWSRVELAALTPRAAGTLGAAVLTVGGASVAVPVTSADGLRPAPVAAPPNAAPTAQPAAAVRVVAKPAARAANPPAVGGIAVRAKPAARPAQQSRPVAEPPPTFTRVAEPSAEPAATLAAGTPQAVPVAADLPLPPLPPVSLPVPVPLPLPVSLAVPPQLPLPGSVPLPVAVTPPAVPAVVETVAGAAGAAGASAPPLPVPAVPLPTLPQAP